MAGHRYATLPRLLAATALVAGSRRGVRARVSVQLKVFGRFRRGGAPAKKDDKPPAANMNRSTPLSIQHLADDLDAAAPTIAALEGKDVVVYLGDTGAGKTTALHVTLGGELKPTKDGGRCVYEAAEPIPGATISHGKSSRTKTVTPFLHDGVFYVDTPGFKDTGGEHIDILTNILMQKIAASAGRVHYCVVICCNSLYARRGGLLREVAKLIDKFVPDFERRRHLFTFVFTHADQAEEFPRRPGRWSKSLHSILQAILGGTAENSKEGSILQHMVQCLEEGNGKDSGAVLLLNPAKPDGGNLHKRLHEAVTTTPASAVPKVGIAREMTNGLSLGMLRWREAFERRLLSMGTDADANAGGEVDVDAERLTEVEGRLQVAMRLSQHVDFPSVAEAVSSMLGKVKSRMESLSKRAVALLDSPERTELGKVKECRRCWQQAEKLRGLLEEMAEAQGQGQAQGQGEGQGQGQGQGQGSGQASSHLVERHLQRLENWVPGLRDALSRSLAGAGLLDSSALTRLRELRLWAEVDAEFKGHWQGAREDAQAYLQRATEVAEEDSHSDSHIQQYLQLVRLQPQLLYIGQLGIDTTAIEPALQQVSALVKHGMEQDLSKVRRVLCGGESWQQLKPVVQRLCDAHRDLSAAPVPTPPNGIWEAAQDSDRELLKLFRSRVDEWREAGQEDLRRQCVGLPLREAVELLATLRSSLPVALQQKISFGLERLLAAAQKVVGQQQQTAHSLLEQELGLTATDAAALQQVLERLKEADWLDEALKVNEAHLPSREASGKTAHSVQTCNAELQTLADARAKSVSQAAEGSLSTYLADPVKSDGELERLRQLWPEVDKERVTGLQELLQGFVSQRHKVLQSVGEGPQEELFPELEAVLRVRQDLMFLTRAGAEGEAAGERIPDEFEALAQSAFRTLQAWSENVDKVMHIHGGYDRKAALLAMLRDCRHELVRSHLPLYETLREQISDHVCEKANCLSKETDLEKQGEQLEMLQGATALDDHLGGLVGTVLQPWKELHDLRCSRTQELIDGAMKEMDFKRLSEELVPMFQSKEETQRKFAQDTVRQLKARLETRKVGTGADSPAEMMSFIRVLGEIPDELKTFLLSEECDVTAMVKELTDTAEEHFKTLQAKVEESLDSFDYATAARTSERVQRHGELCREILSEAQLETAEKLLHKVAESPQEVQRLADMFCNHLRGQPWKAELERLPKMLSRMKSLRSQPSGGETLAASLEDGWLKCHDDVVQRVTQAVRAILSEIGSCLDKGQPHAVALAAYKSLKVLEDQGWGEHWALTPSEKAQWEAMATTATEADRWSRLPSVGESRAFLTAFMSELGKLEAPVAKRSPVGWSDRERQEELSRMKTLLKEHGEAVICKIKEALDKDDYFTAGKWVVNVHDLRGFTDNKELQETLRLADEKGKSLSKGLRSAIDTGDIDSVKDDLQKLSELSEHLSVAVPGLDTSAVYQDIINGVKRMLEVWDLTPASELINFLRGFKAKHVRGKGSIDPRKLFSKEVSGLQERLVGQMEESLKDYDYSTCKQLLKRAQDLERNPFGHVGTVGEAKRLCRDHVGRLMSEAEAKTVEKKFEALRSDLERLADVRKGLIDFYPAERVESVVQRLQTQVEGSMEKSLSWLRGTEKEAGHHLKDIGHEVLRIGGFWDGSETMRHFAEEALFRVFDEFQLQQEWDGFTKLFQLGMLLETGKIGKNDEENRVARLLVQNFRHFATIKTAVFRQQTAVTQKDKEVVLGEVTCSRVTDKGKEDVPLDLDTLRSLYERFDDQYNKHVLKWSTRELTQEQLAASVKEQAQGIKECRVDNWSPAREALPDLLAGIFAYVTMAKSGEDFLRITSDDGKATSAETEEDTEERQLTAQHKDLVLLKPHFIQVVGILRLLGCDVEGDDLQSQLLQVRTGEGKSLILGACSAILGLLGFRVRCVCYSKYLSNRDFRFFHDIFEALGVLDQVRYSIITEYSEESMKAGGDPRKLTRGLVELTVGSATAGPASTAKEILLIDEVDVLLGPDFYGKTYNPVEEIHSEEAGELLQQVWKNRCQSVEQLLATVRGSEAYKRLLKKYPPAMNWWINLELRKMCSDVKHFNNPKPVPDVENCRVGYRIMDGIDYDTLYEYRTYFAIIDLVERNIFKDSAKALSRASSLQIACGHFSYANINPERILGVSGTVVQDSNWKIMNKYGIQQCTYMPSVYGTTNLQFLSQTKPITVVPQNDLYREVTEQAQGHVKAGRAVLIFFKDEKAVEEYTKSSFFKRFRDNGGVLCESQSDEEKQRLIDRAATARRVTICSKQFGRGSDFFCADRSVERNGGTVVIQAFFSTEKSEEVQIQGRTARQGQQGIYSQVLSREDLQTLDVNVDNLKDRPPKEVYEELDGKRTLKCAEEAKKMEQAVAGARKLDAFSRKYKTALLDPSRRTECPALLEKLSMMV